MPRRLLTNRQTTGAHPRRHPGTTDAQHPYGPANVLTIDQVAGLVLAAGWSPRPGGPGMGPNSPAAIAVAVAYRESRFDARIVNISSGATGLFQIIPGNRALTSPRANTIAAHAMYVARGWNPWNGGRDRLALPTGIDVGPAEAAVQARIHSVGLQEVAGAAAHAIGSPFDILHSIPAYLKIAAGGLGLLATGVAIVALSKGSPVGAAIDKGTDFVPYVGQAKAVLRGVRSERASAATARSERRVEQGRQLAYRASREARTDRRSAAEARSRLGRGGSPGTSRRPVLVRSGGEAVRV